MHRTYTAEKFVELVRRVRDARKGIAITTDVIVGFPGEIEEDYQQTRALVEEIKFDNAFVFRYSPRRDTPAAEMANQVDENTKERRNQDLLEVVNESALRINERLLGRTLEVLCEGPSKTNSSRLMGRTPTNKIVVFEGSDDLVGTLLDVRIERATGFSLFGRPSDLSAMAISATTSHEASAH
jgi:tRNA-2-methylthio-N6-dimethylallyladenosine synthase